MRLDRVKLQTELIKKEMTQKELADLSGFSRSTINAICRGKGCYLSTAKAIAKALNATLEELL